jgi:hypothetical protein
MTIGAANYYEIFRKQSEATGFVEADTCKLAHEVVRAAGAEIDDQKNPGISSICKADSSKQITIAASY